MSQELLVVSSKRYSITEEDVKIHFSEILKVNVFSRPLLERNYKHGSILKENKLFSRNCDIKATKCEERHGRFYLGKDYF